MKITCDLSIPTRSLGGLQITAVRPGGQPLRREGDKNGRQHAGEEGVAPGHEPVGHQRLLQPHLGHRPVEQLVGRAGHEHTGRRAQETAAQHIDKGVGWQPAAQRRAQQQGQGGGRQAGPDGLRERLGLRDVVIAPVDDSQESVVLQAIGAAGANYLESTLSVSDRVGISSWSATLLAVADAMNAGATKVNQIVQMQGGVGNPAAQVQATRLTDQFAKITSAEPKYLAAPGLVASKQVRDGLLTDPYIAEVVTSWQQLSVALVGIGGLQPSPLLKDSGNTISQSDLNRLREAGAIGDLCLHFFDSAGSAVSTDLEQRIIGISAGTLLNVPRRIGFAGGSRKIEAIRAAAKGNWIDVLVTDSITALALLS